MEVADVFGEPDSWGERSQWKPSQTQGGTPGTAGLAPQVTLGIQGQTVLLRFIATPNERYRIEALDPLGSGPWQTLVDLPAAATERVVEHGVPMSSSTRFFRVSSGQ